MSKLRSRNSLLLSSSRTAHSNSAKDDILAMKYLMDKPDIPIYPFNDIEAVSTTTPVEKQPNASDLTYPDYKPWLDHTQVAAEKVDDEKDKLNNSTYLNKGYFELPLVANEYYSARNLIQATLFLSTANCNEILKELSQHLTNAYKARNEVINKIRFDSHTFKIPPRVTLTALKKEAWLKDLANPAVPLLKVSNRLPHGIRNKVLVDGLCSKNVPIKRALWFTKCSLYSELVTLRRKLLQKHPHSPHPLPQSSIEFFEVQWLQEWTQQVVDYVNKFAREMTAVSSPEKKLVYSAKLAYLLNYVQTLYIENLLDRTFFLSSVLNNLREGLPLDPQHVSEMLAVSRSSEGDDLAAPAWLNDTDMNYGLTLVALTLIKIFWKDLLKQDYLCKELSELLLLRHFFILKVLVYLAKHSSTIINHKASLPANLKQRILSLISDSVSYLFKFNTNVFIIPNYWMLIGESLYKILLEEGADGIEQEEIQKQLQLIRYRNESLMLNMKHLNPTKPALKPPHHRRSSFLISSVSASQMVHSPSFENYEGDHTYINRAAEDVLKIIEQFDRLKLNDELAGQLMPKLNSSKDLNRWKVNLRLAIYWCVTRSRSPKPSSESILILCNFIKRKVLQTFSGKSANSLKAQFENEILDVIYNLAESNLAEINYYNLYVLINELYQLKVITISSYLRKLIASGIFYLSPGAEMSPESTVQVKVHLEILQNLPVLNNRQCDSILKKWTTEGFDFNKKFEEGKKVLNQEIIQRLVTSDSSTKIGANLDYIKDLEVGLKFLLVNWITTVLKTTISESPKLIHITPSIIANIYDFYSMCDNLTVFFKAFVKFILKNEGKVIIFYLDSLYLITKLIIQHFKLVKFIAGNNYDSATTGYDLFKLIIINYKDLLSRDADYYRFGDVWRFIDTVVEKSSSFEGASPSKSKNLIKGPFTKDTVDSPMKIASQEARGNEKYSFDEFRNDLDALLDAPPKLADTEEVAELNNILGLSITFGNLAKAQKAMSLLIDQLYQQVDLLSEDKEKCMLKLIIIAKRILHSENDKEHFKQCIIKAIAGHDDSLRTAHFLKKLLSYEVFHLHEVLLLLQELGEDNRYKTICEEISYEILFGEEIDGKELFNHQLLILNSLRCFYGGKHSTNLLYIIIGGLQQSSGNVYESRLLLRYRSRVLPMIQNCLFLNTKYAIDTLVGKLQLSDVTEICNDLLFHDRFIHVDKDSYLVKLTSVTNAFNLPIAQTLLRVFTLRDFDTMEGSDVESELEAFVRAFLDSLDGHFLPQDAYFGELFSYLDWNHKVTIFNYLENSFLHDTVFHEADNEEIAVLQRPGSNVNLLPAFKDYFVKFCVSSVENVLSTPKFFQDLSQFLNRLVRVVNSDFAMECENNDSLGSTISVFLRILIIHKMSLTQIILRHDREQYGFICNLIELLNSRFLSKVNEKLRIMLYDLLLLMKSSLTQELTNSAENELMELIPLATPIPLSVPAQLGSPGADELMKMSDYPSTFPSAPVSEISQMFNLPEPNRTNPFKQYLDESRVSCAIMLDEKELQGESDINSVNNANLVLVPSARKSASLTSAFGILEGPGAQKQQIRDREFVFKSFQLLEDNGGGLNDGCINLLLFDAYTTKENPP